MKKNQILSIFFAAVLLFLSACKDEFLTITPNGALDEKVLATESGVNALLIGAYAMLDGSSNTVGLQSTSTNWIWSDIRSLQANKGTDAGDMPDLNPIVTFTETATNPFLNLDWRQQYEGISRCNTVIVVANKAVELGNLTQAKADEFIMQARALRGWYHFEAWRMWEKIAYVDETTDPKTVTNTDDVTDKIIADLTEGTKLPLDMGQIGRWNKTVSQVMLAKALMQIDHDYATALTLLQDVKTNGKNPKGGAIGLSPTYGDIFDIVNRNGIEAVYTVQYSVNDGSGGQNAGWGEILNFPYKSGGSPGGCCGFFQPTQEFVNSFRTAGGLPLLDNNYNTQAVVNDQGVPRSNFWSAATTYAKDMIVSVEYPNHRGETYYKSLVDNNTGNNPASSPGSWSLLRTWEEDAGPLDPRVDWSVGRKGIFYWDWGIMTGVDWIRDPNYAGPYAPKKQVYKKSQQGQLTDISSWTSGLTANGYRMIRYADVLLLLAECQIETNKLDDAKANINLVRARAANSAGWVKEADGTTNAANYVIAEYPASGYPFDTQANARLALQMERKLELGQEGHSFWDLKRWGIAVSEINRALTYEKTMPWGSPMYGSATFGAEDLTYPVPQRQIDLSNGNIVQNR